MEEYTTAPLSVDLVDVLTLDDFDAADTAVMEIVPPRGARPLGTITFSGPGHEKTRRLSDEATRKRLFEERQKAVNNRYKPPEKTPDQVVEENSRWIADRILDWSIKGRDSEGKIVDVPFTHKTAMALLSDPRKGWLFDQALGFLAQIENFIRASSQT